MDTIKEIEHIINNKKTLTQIIMEVLSLFITELLCWVPFVASKLEVTPLGDSVPIIFLIFGNFILITLYLPQVKTNIECYIKYNKVKKSIKKGDL